MDFINWWFDQHYILSTAFTPGMTLAWCGFKGLFWRGVVALLILLITVGN